jgi:hypothetical protein
MTFSIQQAKRFYYRLGSPAALRHTAGTGCPNVGIINDTPSICLLTSPGPPTPGATIIFYVSPLHTTPSDPYKSHVINNHRISYFEPRALP